MNGYIYKTTNLLNNKVYIGKKTSNHFLTDYYGSGTLIKGALLLYGKDNFKVELLEEISDLNIMDVREQYWISYYNSTSSEYGYNISSGGVENDFIAKTSNYSRQDEEYLQLRKLYREHNSIEKNKNLIVRIKDDSEILILKKLPLSLKKKFKRDTRYDERSILVIHKNGIMIQVPHYLLPDFTLLGWEVGYI